MTRIEEYHKSLKDYFGDDVTDTFEVGKHVQEMFAYCEKHQLFWNASIVRPDCLVCLMDKENHKR
jgi:hypothetical protein